MVCVAADAEVSATCFDFARRRAAGSQSNGFPAEDRIADAVLDACLSQDGWGGFLTVGFSAKALRFLAQTLVNSFFVQVQNPVSKRAPPEK